MHSLRDVINKYLNEKANEEEKALLEKWFDVIGIEENNFKNLSKEDKDKLFEKIYSSDRFTQHNESLTQNKKAKNITRKLSYGWRIAAAILVLIGISSVIFFYIKKENAAREYKYIVYTSKAGEVKELVLPDSSHIWMNANSRVVYRSDFLTNREIKLEGECLFDVTHDAAHPFSVLIKDSIRVKVLGTKFDFSNYGNGIKLSVVRGRVSFANKYKVLDTLYKGQAINYNFLKGSFEKTDIDDISKIGSWVSGQWQFDNMNVNDLARLLYDQYGVKLIIKKEALQKITMNANFTKSQSSEDIIKVYSTLVQCKYRWAGKSVIVLY